MKIYRKLPIEIQAVQFTGRNYDEVCDFIGDGNLGKGTSLDNNLIVISTLEGEMNVSVDDYVIKGIRDEFYPCKPGIFLATYEEVK